MAQISHNCQLLTSSGRLQIHQAQILKNTAHILCFALDLAKLSFFPLFSFPSFSSWSQLDGCLSSNLALLVSSCLKGVLPSCSRQVLFIRYCLIVEVSSVIKTLKGLYLLV